MSSEQRIVRVKITGLFGKYSYEIPESGDLGKLVILYGDNGVGKSTILRLLFHLLSAANNRGHRNAILKIPFSSAEVYLSDGVSHAAEKVRGSRGDSIILSTSRGGKKLTEWHYSPLDREAERQIFFDMQDERMLGHIDEDMAPMITTLMSRYSSKVKKDSLASGTRKKTTADNIRYGERAYLEELRKTTPRVFYVSADRRLESDSLNQDEIRQARPLSRNEDIRDVSAILGEYRSSALKSALANTANWINKAAVVSANQGSMNVHSAYGDVIDRLGNDYSDMTEPQRLDEISRAISDLQLIRDRTREYAQYELTTSLDVERMLQALRRPGPGGATAAKVISPYIESLKGRLNALQEVYVIIDRFVKTVNDFLSDKQLRFSLSRGFSIVDGSQKELDSSHLSSGEQHLLLMFCYLLSRSDEPSVFIIDEPEISLNVKWQRNLLRALDVVSEKSDVQLMFASHSIELISQHRNSVTHLRR